MVLFCYQNAKLGEHIVKTMYSWKGDGSFMEKISVIIGERIRIFRKRAGLSQEKLAELADVHNTYIGQLERGDKNASLETIETITRALGISFETLFEEIIPETHPSESHGLMLDYYNKVNELPENEQLIIYQIIDTALKLKC